MSRAAPLVVKTKSVAAACSALKTSLGDLTADAEINAKSAWLGRCRDEAGRGPPEVRWRGGGREAGVLHGPAAALAPAAQR